MSEDEYYEISSETEPTHTVVEADSVALKTPRDHVLERKVKIVLFLLLVLMGIVSLIIHRIPLTSPSDVISQDSVESTNSLHELSELDSLTAAHLALSGEQSATVCGEATAWEQFKTLHPDPNVPLIDAPQLQLDSYPNYYAVLTSDSPESPIYVIQDGSRHVVDVEATVGYNTATPTELQSYSTPKFDYLRVVIKEINEPSSNRYYGTLTATLSNDPIPFTLYYEKLTELGKQLERALMHDRDLRYTIELSLRDTESDPKYFISSIHKRSWVYKKESEIDVALLPDYKEK